jgi:hypothetical protein
MSETDGSYLRPPVSSSKVVVWGAHAEAVKSVTTWLVKQGHTVVDELKIKELARENNLPMPLSDIFVLKFGKIAGAKEVIFVDADVSTWKFPDVLELIGQSSSAYKASLFIRAVDVETGEINWNGKAVSQDKFPDLAKGIHQLSCNALATGWGLRKPGVNANANVCPEGQNIMTVDGIPTNPPTTSKDIVKSSHFPELETHR